MKNLKTIGIREPYRERAGKARLSSKTLHHLIRLHGLDYAAIARSVGSAASDVERLLLRIESVNSKFVERALKKYKARLRRTGKDWRRQAHGLFPLEYYLCASYK